MGYSGVGMKLIHEKNLKSTTSCQIPFKANTHVGSYKLFYSMPYTVSRWSTFYRKNGLHSTGRMVYILQEEWSTFYRKLHC
jgi:hypothetical protein